MTTNVVEVKDFLTSPKKANQCLADAKRLKPTAQLFDEFWRDGELALLFGAHATGKSILAVQSADALARGTPLAGFRMPRGRRKVLYVDMDLSDAQFQARYGSGDTPVPMSAKREKLSKAETASVRTRVSSPRSPEKLSNAETASVGTRVSSPRSPEKLSNAETAFVRTRVSSLRFPERLYRGRPPVNVDLCEWVRTAVMENGFQIVIIDSLSAIKRTHDGTVSSYATLRKHTAKNRIVPRRSSVRFLPSVRPRQTVDIRRIDLPRGK